MGRARRVVFRCVRAHHDIINTGARIPRESSSWPSCEGWLSMHGISDGGLVRDRRSGRVRGIRVGPRRGAGRPRRGPSGTPRLVLEVLLWLVGRYGEQDVMLHVCCKAIQRRPFRMTSLKVGARRALGAVGGAWRDSATMCYSEPGAGRSGGVLPGPVALRALEVASYRRSRGQGSGSTTHL